MPAVLTYKVTEKDSGKTVEDILRSQFDVSGGVLKSLKHPQKLFLDNEHCRTVDKALENQIILADVTENVLPPSNIKPFEGNLKVLYEDDFILVVDKPGGIESHPCMANHESTLANIIMYYWAQRGEYHNYHIVNRLDKGTSGISVIAKNPFSHGNLSNQMQNNIFKKYYMAFVHGEFDNKSGFIDLPIGRANDGIIKREVRPDGRQAKTFYDVILKGNGYSLLKVFLETGRTHQIRVHFSYMNHPLIGDWLYGDGDNERHLIKRPALHTKTVEFLHPATKEKMIFDTNFPPEMQNILKLCEK